MSNKTVNINQSSIYLFKGMVVELKNDTKMGGENFKKGTVGLVIKDGKKQSIKFLKENGETASFAGDFSNLVIESDQKFESDNVIQLEHGMKVEMKEAFNVGKEKFKKGAIGIVFKINDATQKLMIENAQGWYVEIKGDFSERVNVLNKKK